MKTIDFLKEFDENQIGPWISFDDHDPPFAIGTLRAMEAAGVIELEVANRRYRLIPRATAAKGV
jgi:hypothetical protein